MDKDLESHRTRQEVGESVVVFAMLAVSVPSARLLQLIALLSLTNEDLH